MKRTGSKLPLLIFYFGVFCIPFDNFRFTPSAGWAAISPYIFFVSAVLFFVSNPALLSSIIFGLKKHSILLFLAISTLVSYCIFDIYSELIVLNFLKIFLGFCFYVSLIYAIKKGENFDFNQVAVDKFAKILSIGYFLSIVIGVIQFLSVLGFFPVLPFELIYARYYQSRVQFTFTEPSFVTLHAIGIIFLTVSTICKQDSIYRKILISEAFVLVFISMISGSSVRVLVDCFLLVLWILFFTPSSKKIRWLVMIAVVAIPFSIAPPAALVERLDRFSDVERIVDPSAEIRKFRSEAAFLGVLDNAYSFILGYGAGNSAAAMKNGFDEAYQRLNSSLVEIEELRSNPDGLTYSMHVKILAEHGILGYLLILFLLFDKKKKIIFGVVLIVYLQFDSFAFYSLWLYLVARYFNIGRDIPLKTLKL